MTLLAVGCFWIFLLGGAVVALEEVAELEGDGAIALEEVFGGVLEEAVVGGGAVAVEEDDC